MRNPIDKIGLFHADCGGDWTLVDQKAYCNKCSKVQDISYLCDTPIISAVTLGTVE